MFKKLYEKNELYFALLWIGIYVLIMNIALQVCDGFDNLAEKTAGQVFVPVVCILVLAAASTLWIVKNGLTEKYGFCRFKGKASQFLWFVPLILISCVNLLNGLTVSAPIVVMLLMMVNMSVAGYVEEIIFRGFLFRAMEKDNLKAAIIVSAVTFGAGHIVNLANTADTFGVFMQVFYAIAIGFMFTVIAYKGGSLWPCILSHMFVNGSSIFAVPSSSSVELATSIGIIVVSGAYAYWLWINQE